MKYYVLNGAKKYDSLQNEDKGCYRDWAVVLDLLSDNGKKYVGYHSETYYWEGSGWEDDHHGPTYWSELPEDFYEKYHQVDGEECSKACEAVWYKFKEYNGEKVEMEKATNSKIDFIKNLETENVHSSHNKDMTNTPISDIKKVMGWLIEDKDVVYRPIHPGIPDSGAGKWLKVDPKNPILAEDYEYQLAESMWTFRVPDWHFEASSREDALQKAYTWIMENPASIVVYPGAKGLSTSLGISNDF